MKYINTVFENTLDFPSLSAPIIIKCSSFINLKGCFLAESSNNIYIKFTSFVNSYYENTIRIVSSKNITIEYTCLLSCESSTFAPLTGDVVCAAATNKLSIKYLSVVCCTTHCTSMPSGYLDLFQGECVSNYYTNYSKNYGLFMPGNQFTASYFKYKYCYTGQSQSSIASIEIHIYVESLIENINIDKSTQLGSSLKAFYVCGCKIPIVLNSCVFNDIAAAYDIYSNGAETSINKCCFSISNPRTNGNVIIGTGENYFNSISSSSPIDVNCLLVCSLHPKYNVTILMILILILNIYSI